METTFIKAKKHKNLRALLLIQRAGEHEGKPFLRLAIEQINKINDLTETIFVESVVDSVKIENYSNFAAGQNRKRNIVSFAFHMFVHGHESHIRTFLNKITPKNKPTFKIVAYNGSSNDDETNIVRHQLYGIIGNDVYFLSDYVGQNNSASPIKEY